MDDLTSVDARPTKKVKRPRYSDTDRRDLRKDKIFNYRGFLGYNKRRDEHKRSLYPKKKSTIKPSSL